MAVIESVHLAFIRSHVCTVADWLCRYDPTRLLITMGADINKQDKVNGNTPLHFACQTGNTCVVKILFDKKADLNFLNGKVRENINYSPLRKFSGYIEITMSVCHFCKLYLPFKVFGNSI